MVEQVVILKKDLSLALWKEILNRKYNYEVGESYVAFYHEEHQYEEVERLLVDCGVQAVSGKV